MKVKIWRRAVIFPITISATFAFLLATSARCETYSIVEQDTHSVSMIDIDTIKNLPSNRKYFRMITISAWPELWQDSYGQISEHDVEIDCWKKNIKLGLPTSKNIEGEIVGIATYPAAEWVPVSDGYNSYEAFVCRQESKIALAPFKSLDVVKKYYFQWLMRNVPVISK